MVTIANGHSMHYEISGKPGGTVLAFSHSLASSCVMWEKQAEFFGRDFAVLRYDIRGHGESAATPAPYTLEQLASDFTCLLDALRVERVHFVGLSLGGMIGQAMGILHPDRLLSLCLCDTSCRTTPEGVKVWEERIAAVRKNGLAPQLEPTMKRWFSDAYIAKGSPLLDRIRERFAGTPVEGYVGCAEAIRRLDFQDLLSSIRVPVQVMVGENDPGTPVAAARAIQARIDEAKLVIIPGTLHLPNVERPEAFNEALASFLSAHR